MVTNLLLCKQLLQAATNSNQTTVQTIFKEETVIYILSIEKRIGEKGSNKLHYCYWSVHYNN